MNSDMGAYTGEFGIARWRAWSPGVTQSADWRGWLENGPSGPAEARPDVTNLPAMLRRRLDRAGRMAFATAMPCLEGLDTVETVFGSRHGSLKRTLKMLDSIAHDEPVSPTVFSLAVHNSVAGLLSIARGDRGASTALAAGEDTLAMCLVEGAGLLAEGADKVLVIFAEERVPAPYDEIVETPATHPFGISLLLSADEATCRCRLQMADESASEPPERALMRFLVDDRREALVGVDQRWRLERR